MFRCLAFNFKQRLWAQVHKHSDQDVKIFWAGSKQVASTTLPRSQKQGESSPQKKGKNKGTVNLLHLSTTNSFLQKALWLPLRITEDACLRMNSRALVCESECFLLHKNIHSLRRQNWSPGGGTPNSLNAGSMEQTQLASFSCGKAGSSGWRDHGSAPYVGKPPAPSKTSKCEAKVDGNPTISTY